MAAGVGAGTGVGGAVGVGVGVAVGIGIGIDGTRASVTCGSDLRRASVARGSAGAPRADGWVPRPVSGATRAAAEKIFKP